MASQSDYQQRQYGEGRLVYETPFPRLRRTLKHRLNDRLDVALKLVRKVRTGGTLLDYGCGAGAFLEQIGQCQTAFDHLQGVDLVQENVRQASGRCASSTLPTTVRCGNERLLETFASESVSCIVCLAVIEVCVDPYDLLHEFHRILTPTGRLVLSVPNTAYLRHRFRLLFGTLPTTSPTSIELWPEVGWETAVLHRFTRETLLKLLGQTGFEPEALEATGFAYGLVRRWPSVMGTGFVVMARRRDPEFRS